MSASISKSSSCLRPPPVCQFYYMLEASRTNPYFFTHSALTKLVNMEPSDMVHEILHHRGGVADREYISRQSYLSGLPVAVAGQPIPMDGQIAAHAIAEVIYCCAQLVDEVDGWLANNES
jgi:hypothetical protein